MATVAQVQGERKALLREVRRRERAVDTRLETIERRLFRLLDKKQLVAAADMEDLLDRYKGWFNDTVKPFEKALVDSAYVIVQEF